MTDADFTKAVEVVVTRMERGIITGDMLSVAQLVMLVRNVSPPGAELAVLETARTLSRTRTEDLITRGRRVRGMTGNDEA
jgi:hypothetical protein